jgi:DNA polymerase III delta subunit
MAKAAPAKAKGSPWSRETLPRVLLIAGAESALREETIAAAKKAALGDADPGLNWIVLHGPLAVNDPNQLIPADVLDELCTASMFSSGDELKVVLLRQADVFLGKYYAVLEENLERIPETSTLILEATGWGKLKSTRFYKALCDKKAVVECEALIGKFGDSPELETEVDRRARARGLQLNHAALLALLNRSAKNLAVIEEELDKLALVLKASGGDSVAVSEQHIEELCASTATYNAFNFVDAVLDRSAARALEVLGGLMERGLTDSNKPGKVITQESSIAMVVLGALTWKLAQLQDLQAALDAGTREFDAFKAAKIFYRQDAVRATLRRHTAASLRRCMEALFRANMNLRGGRGGGPREVLEELVWTMVKS